MKREEQTRRLNQILLEELPQYQKQAKRIPRDAGSQRALLRGLMNLRPPRPLREDYLALQDELLLREREEKGVVAVDSLPATADPCIALWQGDITWLAADAIVNAANSGMTGCYRPGHDCVDNCIHSAAGAQLRLACQRLMDQQGHEEAPGLAKITPAFNLPSGYVIHTVGPIVKGPLMQEHKRLLASCYRSCLALAAEQGLATIVFPCVSTGVFGFPQEPAAAIAVQSVRAFLTQNAQIKRVVFNVFKDRDYNIYRDLLGADRPSAG
ncbi:MAG: protein-ADP-ribose hydrolase [Oscillospiraceae bacterium]|nr:protein-ADP-ribose hydrolase [Oscillospiraceae bacterium]